MHQTYHFHEVYIYYKLTSGLLSKWLYQLKTKHYSKVPGLNLGEA